MSPAAGVPTPGAPSRRDVVRGAGLLLGAAVTAGLAGCGVRLEDDAPSIPLLQRRSIPDEGTLIATFHLTTSLSQMAGRIPGAPALVSQLNGIHDSQAKVLHGVLTRGGVPDHVIDSTGSTASATSTATAAVSAPPPATVALLATTEASSVSPASLALLAGATASNRTLLTAIAAQRAFAAGLLGAAVSWPTAEPVPATPAAGLLEATRAATYAFEVVAAQLRADGRPAALATLSQLRARERELTAMAGASAAPAPLGYALPFSVTTPELARTLAAVVLTQLAARGLDPLAALPTNSAAVTTVVRLQVGAQSLGGGWGVAMAPFPGMVYP